MHLWLSALSLAGLLATSVRANNSELVAKVMAGDLKEAHASWWGFDKTDSTHALQAAIDSRVPRLIVDNMGAPWITDRLTCVSDQEIDFEKGVEVLAKKDAFRGQSDALFSLTCVTNVILRGVGATLRMRRADYDAPPYTKAEWRHVLNIKSSANIEVYGLTLSESGGDGIYLGCVRSSLPNRDIHIKGVLCDKNYRQGISVISVENLLIEDTVMRDTAGTSPAAGIDFEPNVNGERLKNCVMRNCVTENNQGNGFDFYLPNLTGVSEPVSIRIDNCRSVGDKIAVGITTGNTDKEAVRGELLFSNCRFEKAVRNGVMVRSKPAVGMVLAFKRCVVYECAADTNLFSDILLSNVVGDENPVGGIRFDLLTVLQPTERSWLVWQNNTTVVEPLASLSGNVIVKQGKTQTAITVTSEWLAKHFPPRFSIRVPRVSSVLATARITDGAEGVQKLSPLRLRHSGTYVLYATMGREVILIGQQSQVGNYVAATKPTLVRSSDGKVVKQTALPSFSERAEVRFTPDQTGFYTLEVDVGANAFILLEASVPVAIDTTKKAVGLIASTGSLFAQVPKGTEVFAFGVAGEGCEEAVHATVIDPSGKPVWTRDNITQMERFTSKKDSTMASGLWQINFEKPIQNVFEDYYVEVLGVPGYLFLNRERYWSF